MNKVPPVELVIWFGPGSILMQRQLLHKNPNFLFLFKSKIWKGQHLISTRQQNAAARAYGPDFSTVPTMPCCLLLARFTHSLYNSYEVFGL